MDDGESKAASERRGRDVAHGANCSCVRCTGFQRRNVASHRHGGYGLVAIGGRVAEISDALRGELLSFTPADEPMLAVTSFMLARLERAAAALAEADAAGLRLPGLEADARSWAAAARRALRDLAATPSSRCQLLRDLG